MSCVAKVMAFPSLFAQMMNGTCLSLKIQWSRLSEGEKAEQTETETLSHILCRDLYLDSVIPCQYLQLVCEEDTQNMLRSEQWEVLPRSSNKEKYSHIWLLLIVARNRIKDNLVHLKIRALHSLSKRNQKSQIISAVFMFLAHASHYICEFCWLPKLTLTLQNNHTRSPTYI